MRGLIIRQPWIDLILDGSKTWEIRSRNTKVRELIALIEGGSGHVVGTARLEDVAGPLDLDEMARHQDQHQVPQETLAAFLARYRNRAYAWMLKDAERLRRPVAYTHPSGAVIWVRLPDDLLRS